MLATLRRDIGDAVRGARHRPGFATAVLLTLGIGIGATAAVFSVVDAVLIRPLPYPDAQRVTGVWFSSPNFPGGLSRVRQSPATFLHIRDRSEVFASFGLAEQTAVTVDADGRPTRVAASVVTPEMFDVLGLIPAAGRRLLAEDNVPGAEPVVVLAHVFWREQFGEDAGAIGRILLVDGVARRIVGVLPEAVRFPANDTRLWIPLEVDPANAVGDFVFTGYGRLKPGVDPEAATRDFDRLVNLLPDVYPRQFPRALLDRLQLSSLFVPLQDELVGESRQSLVLVLMAVFVVLLIVIANVANLFLIRNESRHRDFAIQAALGAGLGRLARALITEAVVYAAAGGVLGLAVGAAALRVLTRLGPSVIPRVHEVSLNMRTLLATALLSLLTGIVVGIVPVQRLRRANLNGALRAGGKTIGTRHGLIRLRWALVAGQVALALALLVNAGLLARSFNALRTVDPGFRADGVLAVRLFLSERDYPTYADVSQFYLQLVDDMRRLPGVDHAAAVTFLPLRDGRIFMTYEMEDAPATTDLPAPRLTKVVTGGYFDAMGIPLRRGRYLEQNDLERGTDVVVVNQAFADEQWPGADPIGKRLRYAGVVGDTASAWFSVVGVVGDVRDRDLTAVAAAIVYFPLQERHARDRRWREMSLAIRGAAPEALLPSVRQAVAARDRGLPVYEARTMTRVLQDATARARYTTVLLVAVALGALFLAAIGLYGVLAYIVAERRREMGLRIAVGARPEQVRALVMSQAVALAAVGGLLGVGVTLGTNRLVARLLYGVHVVDAPTFIAVASVLGAVTWLAASIPAHRAAAVPPAITLREE